MSKKPEKKQEPKPTPVARPKRFEEEAPRTPHGKVSIIEGMSAAGLLSHKDFDSVGRPIAELTPPPVSPNVACPVCGAVMASNRCPIDGYQLVDSP
jgi:hypothetical protein